MSAELVHEMRVRYAECDPQGIVFNSRYLEYFDVALTELWREALGSYDAVMEELGIDLVVAEAGIRFRASLRFDEVFELRASLSRLGTTAMTTAIELHRGDDLVAEGDLRHVFVDREGGAKAEIPEQVRAALVPYVRGVPQQSG